MGRAPLPVIEPEAELAIAAWRWMGGIDWAALPIVCEVLDVHDFETWLEALLALRDYFRERRE